MTTIVLPERDDMLARLKSVMDEPLTVNGLYPLLLELQVHAWLDETEENAARLQEALEQCRPR